MLLWIEGFEDCGTDTNVNLNSGTTGNGFLARRYATVYNDPGYPGVTLTLAPGRVSGYSVVSDGAGSNYPYLVTRQFATTADTMIVGLGFKRTADTNAWGVGFPVLQFRSGAAGSVILCMNDASEFRVSNGAGATLGTTSGAGMSSDVWLYVELKVKCHASQGTVTLKINGVTKLELTGLDTHVGAATFHDTVRFGTLYRTYLDDIYICDNAGALNADFLGDQRVLGVLPSSDGDTLEWTPSTGETHSTLVDESLDNDDTDYVTGVAGQLDRYVYGGLFGNGLIAGIQVNTSCRETDTNAHALITHVTSGSTVYEDAGQAVGTQAYTQRCRVIESDPETSALWTVAGISAAQIGMKVG